MLELDAATKARSALIYPDVRVRAFRTYQDFFNLHNLALRMLEGLRTFETQAAYYAKGRHQVGGAWVLNDPIHHAGVVTYAKPGESIHHYGAAFDTVFVGADPYLEALSKTDPKRAQFLWLELGRLAKANGLVWGGDWNGDLAAQRRVVDRPHCQLTYGHTLTELKALYQTGGLKACFAAFDKVRRVEQGSEWDGTPGLSTSNRAIRLAQGRQVSNNIPTIV